MIVSLLGLAVIFGAGNLLLVGSQKIGHHGDEVRLDEIKRTLDSERPALEQVEGDLGKLDSALDGAKSRLDDLSSWIDAIENANPRGGPAALFGDYRRLVDEYNALIGSYNADLSRFKALYPQYSDRVDRYNAMITDANSLARSSGTTWYIIPRPRIGAHAFAPKLR